MKTVLLLGAGSDIARATAHAYAERGDRVVLASRSIDDLEKTASDLRHRHGAEATALRFDALDYESHRAFYDALDPKPDVVVVAFGYLGEQKKGREDFAEAKRILDTNYTGAVSICEIVAADFEKRGEGTLVGIASVAGDRGRQSNYLYGSSKAAFDAYLSGLRNRLFKAGAHVATVKPGFVRTKMTEGMPLPGPVTAEPERVARAILKAERRRKNVVYVKGVWRQIMGIVKAIPEPIFKRLGM
jgi:short-subunit dehydrogenase